MQNLTELPESTNGVVVVLSGGMDSTIAMRLLVEKYGSNRVKALSFFYGQKQFIEIGKASLSTRKLNVKHEILDLSLLEKLSIGFSANVDPNMAMPTIKDVLADPQPKTYVPNRNMILLSIAAAYAETQGCDTIVTGLQIHDTYGYWDTTEQFVESINTVLNQNRKHKIRVVAPFVHLSKTEEIKALLELDGNVDLLKSTLTCYNPNEEGESCGYCPSCAERIKAFLNIGVKDPIAYSRKDIPWRSIA